MEEENGKTGLGPQPPCGSAPLSAHHSWCQSRERVLLMGLRGSGHGQRGWLVSLEIAETEVIARAALSSAGTTMPLKCWTRSCDL